MRRADLGLDWFFLAALQFALPALFLCVSATALDPSRQISQYAHTAWRIQDGAFSGAPYAITQMTRSQVADDKGPLCRITDRAIDKVADQAAGGALQCYGAADGIPFRYAQPLARDDSGNLWIGSSLGLCLWRPGSARAYYSTALEATKGLSGVSAIAAGTDGSLLVGMRRPGVGLGLQQLIHGAWKSFVVPGLDGTAIDVTALLIDRDRALWIGTSQHGIYRVHDGIADHFQSVDGLSSDSVNAFYQDREGNLWITTSRGIDRFHDLRVASFSKREGLTADSVESVLAARDGTVWIANAGALDSIRQGKLSAVREGNGLPGRLVTSMFEDHSGRLWMGIDSGLTVYQNARFRPVNKPDGSPLGVVTAVTEDVDHNIWAEVTQPALFRIQDSQVREEIDPPQIPRAVSLAADPTGGIWLALANGNIARYQHGQMEIVSANHDANYRTRNLLVDSDGAVWAATSAGLVRWKQGKLKILDSRNGLPCDSIFALVRDNLGSLWLDARCGFLAIADSELNKWWEQPDITVRVSVLDVFDGAQPGSTNFRPEASRSPDGKLWFSNDSILQMVDPSHLNENGTPPPVHVEQIVADQKNHLPEVNLRLPARTRNIEIDYTALSFVVPEKVKFRYKLEGHDADWQDPQTRREAFYDDLPPGDYRFRVIASNNDGVWSEMGAVQGFTVLPAFYQTTWFQVLCCITAAGFLWLLYALRLRQLAAQMEARLEERLEERERIARDLHDTLLQGFFSAAMQLDVANDRLPPDSPAKPLVQRVIELMNQVGEQGRNAIRSLRSSQRESYDLEQAFSQIRQEFPAQGSVDFRVIAEGSPRPLKPGVWDEVYRLGREAVINAFRHSQASKIEVEVKYTARHLRILVRDNGCGIDSRVLQTGRDGHWGLSGMRERAERIGARMAVLSRPHAGTDVKLSIPSNVAFESVPSDRWPKWLTGLFQRNNGNKSSTD